MTIAALKKTVPSGNPATIAKLVKSGKFCATCKKLSQSYQTRMTKLLGQKVAGGEGDPFLCVCPSQKVAKK